MHLATAAKESDLSAEQPDRILNAEQVRTVSHDVGSEQFAVASYKKPTAEQRLPALPPSSSASISEKASPPSEAELYSQLLARVMDQQSGLSPTEQERRKIVAHYLMVLAGEPETAVNMIKGFSEHERLALENQLRGLWTLIDPKGHPSSGRRITEALPRFRQANMYLSAATDSLSLRNLEFCTEIESYGQIKPFDGNRFVAGQQVILYCEVENFAAEETAGLFQTRLQGSYDIYDASGTKVVSQLLPMDKQESRNRLRDYFVAYQMHLPQALPNGTYRLQLTIEDVVGKKYGQSNIPFEVR